GESFVQRSIRTDYCADACFDREDDCGLCSRIHPAWSWPYCTWQIRARGADWRAFEFEDQPWFDGFRDLATNGVDKPVLNVFRMLGMMTGNRVAIDNPAGIPLDRIVASGVKEKPDIHALASRDAHSVSVLVSNYHDSGKPAPAADIDLTIAGLPGGRLLMQHYRVDQEFSNSFEAWKKMGSPQQPTTEQVAALESAGHLQAFES